MRKILLKRQMLQVAKTVTVNAKNGARRSTGGMVGMIALFGLCWVSLGFAFFGMTEGLSVLFDVGLGWYVFVLSVLVTLFLGVLGSVFTSMTTIFNARDNELLLSMPIEPKDILFARIFEVWLLCILFQSMAAIPAVIQWFRYGKPNALGGVFSVLIFLLISLLATSLACLVGWIVAMIAAKVKKKNFMTVFFTVVFLTVYYVFYFRIQKILQKIVNESLTNQEAMLRSKNPLFLIGKAAQGDVLGFVIIAVICVLSFVILYRVLSANFLKLATTNRGTAKVEYKEKTAKMTNVRDALLRKELEHFKGSAAYMLNGGLGILVMLAGAVVLVIKKKAILAGLSTVLEDPAFTPFIPLAGAVVVCLAASMNDITAAGISIEAHTLWISKSLPITAYQFYEAKIRMHRLLTLIPAIVLLLAVFFTLEMSFPDFVMMAALVVIFIEFLATFGMVINILMPNMTWTNETAAVKQGIAVLVALFGGMIFAALIGLCGWLLHDKMEPSSMMSLFIAIFVIATVLLRKWLRTAGAKRYDAF